MNTAMINEKLEQPKKLKWKTKMVSFPWLFNGIHDSILEEIYYMFVKRGLSWTLVSSYFFFFYMFKNKNFYFYEYHLEILFKPQIHIFYT